MAMFNNQGSSMPTTFVAFNAKEGTFVIAKKGEAKKSLSQIRDVIVKRVSIKDDEYEGKPVQRLQVTLEDAEERAIVAFNMATGATAKLVALLLKADLDKPLGLSASLQKAGTAYKRADGTMGEPLKNDIAQCGVWQGAGYIRLTTEENPPKTTMVKVGQKDYPDTTARDEWLKGAIANLQAKLGGQATHADASTDDDAAAAAAANAEIAQMGAGECPF